MTAVRRWLNPSRKPMTLKQAARRFALVFVFLFLPLYIAANLMLLGQYGQMDWTTPVQEGCPSGGICGTWEVVK